MTRFVTSVSAAERVFILIKRFLGFKGLFYSS